MKGIIFDIKELGVHDGPGLVSTVFFKGCPLRCIWCHNPEGQSSKKEIMIRKATCKHCGLCDIKCEHEQCKPYGKCLFICPNDLIKEVGEEIEAKELASRLLDKSKVLDGVTFSGGEPLAQSDFLLETISYLKGLQINIETCGYCESEIFKNVISKVDHVYYDVKIVDDKKHIKYTGVSNKLILANLRILKDMKKSCTIRTPLIKGITDCDENIRCIKELIGDLPHELLPENEMASVKYDMLSRTFPGHTFE